MTDQKCLHCEINEIVQQHLEGDDPVNLSELVAKVGSAMRVAGGQIINFAASSRTKAAADSVVGARP